MLKVKGIATTEKRLVVCRTVSEKDGTYKCYSKGQYEYLTNEQRLEIMKRPRSSEFLLVHKPKEYKGSIRTFHDELIEEADALKKATNGKINMYKTGIHSKTSVKFLFDLLNAKKISIDPIEPYEERFLLHCGGAFRLGVPYEGKMYKYDANSYFPSIFSSPHFIVPIKKGILKTITQEEFEKMDFFTVGVYHCEVEVPEDKNLRKLIWINSENYYAHTDLMYAKEKGLKITMIDEKDNCLLYPRKTHCMMGSEIFGEFTKYIYALKLKKIPGAKKLLNNLWGMLVKINKKVVKRNINDENDTNDYEGETYNTEYINDDTEVTYMYRSNMFEYDLARMRPFFASKCRLTMIKIIEPIIDHVFYSHTDSIISNINLNKHLKINDDIGNFKYEGFCSTGSIKNKNEFSGTFLHHATKA